MSLVDNWMDDNKTYHFEGSTGLKKLCKLARDVAGAKDPFSNGCHEHGCMGDLHVFLEDNPGAIQAIVDWMDEAYPHPDDEDGDEDEDELESE